MKKQLKTVVSIVASLSLVSGLVALPTSAYASTSISNDVDESTNWEAPSSYMTNTVTLTDEDGNTTLYKVITTWANAWALSGPDYIGVSNSGVINQSGGGSGSSSLEAAATTTMLGIWASSVNEVPNAYNWNYFYNLALDAAGEDTDESLSAIDVQNGADAGYDTSSGVYACFKYRPEVIWCSNSLSSSAASQYAGYIADGYYYTNGELTQDGTDSEYYIEGDENYSIYIVDPDRNSVLGELDSLYTLAEYCVAVEEETADYNADGAVTEDNVTWQTMNSLPRTTRYEASTENAVSATEAALDVEKLLKGSVYYTLSQIAAGTVEQKTVAFVSGTIDTTGSTATLMDFGDTYEGNRGDAAGKVGVASLVVTELTTDTASGSGYTATADEMLEADYIWAANGSLSETQVRQWLVANATTDENIEKALTIEILTDLPAFMNGHNFTFEKAINGLYDICFFYPELWPDLELVVYWYDNVYHVNYDDLAVCLQYGLGNATMPSGTELADLPGSDYSNDDIDAKAVEGYEYYVSTLSVDEDSVYATDELVQATTYYAEWAAEYEAAAEEEEEQVEVTYDYFTDVLTGTASDSLVEAVYSLAAYGYVTGTSDTTFSPSTTTTRAMMVTILWRIMEPEAYAAYDASSAVSTTFTDVADGKYYTAAVEWAVEAGITTGTSATTFSPDGTCTFEQYCTFVARAINGGDAATNEAVSDSEAATILAQFSDGADTGASYDNSVAFLVEAGVISGYSNGTLVPGEDLTRGRMAQLTWKTIEAGYLA